MGTLGKGDKSATQNKKYFFKVNEGVMGEEKFWWIIILMAMKLHPGFTLGKLVQPSPGISILWDSHIVLSKQS